MPYVGILSEKRSFSTTITPILDLKFDQTITSLDLPAIGCHNSNSSLEAGSGWAGSTGIGSGWTVNHGNVIAYPDKNEIFFLYPSNKKSTIQFDIQNDKHSVIKNSYKSPYSSAGKNL